MWKSSKKIHKRLVHFSKYFVWKLALLIFSNSFTYSEPCQILKWMSVFVVIFAWRFHFSRASALLCNSQTDMMISSLWNNSREAMSVNILWTRLNKRRHNTCLPVLSSAYAWSVKFNFVCCSRIVLLRCKADLTSFRTKTNTGCNFSVWKIVY